MHGKHDIIPKKELCRNLKKPKKLYVIRLILHHFITIKLIMSYYTQ